MEAVSFEDTLAMLRKVVGEDLNEDRMIPVCSEEMYEVIADFGRGLKSDRTARVSTKYKTVDRCREENRPRGELEHKGVGIGSTHTRAPRST